MASPADKLSESLEALTDVCAAMATIKNATDPDRNPDDRGNGNVRAVRGYYDAFISVRSSVEKVLGGRNAGDVSRDDHAEWYRRLFGPSVTAGVIRPVDLAGYRGGPVHIRRSMHVPPPREAVRDCMPALFDLLEGEAEPAVRVVLGHFTFVYIHPYMDGNWRRRYPPNTHHKQSIIKA